MTIRPLYQLAIIAALLYWRVDPRIAALLAVFVACASLLRWRAPRYLDAVMGLDDDVTGDTVTPPAARAEVWACGGAALALAMGCFAVMEYRDPLFFTQDDNFISLGPAALVACRSMFDGIFPVWNPYQGGGEPLAESSYPTTYPPLYLAYAISRYVLRNEYWFLEVLALLHLLLSTAGGFWAGRKWGLSPALAAAASLAFTFSGFMLVTGRCWFIFLIMAAWLPWIFGFCAPTLLRCASWKWALGLGLVLGFAFHACFSQIWAYGVLFACVLILMLWLCRAIPFQKALWMAPALALALAIALPLAYVQMDFAKDVSRSFSDDANLTGIPYRALAAMLVPPPLVTAYHPQGWGGGQNYGKYGDYYYTGAIFTWSCALLLGAMTIFRGPRSLCRRNVLPMLALLALLMSLGATSPVPFAEWMAGLPWFEKFRQPWRYFIFFNLFSCLAGALICERLTRCFKARDVARRSIAIVAILLVCHSLTLPMATFWRRPVHTFPAFPTDLANLLEHNGKPPSDHGAMPSRSASPFPQSEYTYWAKFEGFPIALTGNLASVYEVLSFNRYNTLTWFHAFSKPLFERFNNEPTTAYRAYGIRWVFRHPYMTGPADRRFVEGLRDAGSVGGMMVWEVPDPAPLAFAERDPKAGFPVSFSARGAAVQLDDDFSTEQENIVVNVLGWPRFRAIADGEIVSWSADEWGRMVVRVPAGTRVLEVVYSPRWREGLGLGVLALAASVIMAWGLARLSVFGITDRTDSSAPTDQSRESLR